MFLWTISQAREVMMHKSDVASGDLKFNIYYQRHV